MPSQARGLAWGGVPPLEASLHRRIAIVCAALALVVAARAYADQGPALAFPPPLVSAATERSFPGVWEPLEAGAALVRTSDPAAVWYNPAGIIGTDRSSISANAPGYQLTIYAGSSDNRPTQGQTLRGLPSFVGAVLGREVIPWRNVRIGFGLTNPISAQQGVQASQEVAPGQRSSYLVGSDLESFQAAAAVAWAPWPRLRLGLTVGFSYDSISSTAQSGAEQTATSYSGSLNVSTISANTQQFISSAGVQWELLPWLSLGAVVRPPSVKLAGRSDLTYDGVLNADQEKQEHLQGTGSFELRQPLQVNFGVAAQVGRRVNIEADLFWHFPSGAYTLIGAPATVRMVSAGAGGSAPTVVNSPFPDIRTRTRSILNASLGANYHVAEKWWLEGGMYLDQSPTPNDDVFFEPTDFYGARIGCSLRADKGLSGSLGVGYELGFSNRPPGTSSPLGNAQLGQGDLNVHTFTLLLAVGYRF